MTRRRLCGILSPWPPPLFDGWELRERLRAELAINAARLSATRRELEGIVT